MIKISRNNGLNLEIEKEKTVVESDEEKSVWKKKIENEISQSSEKSKNEKEKWLNKIGEDRVKDPKKDHKNMSRALENPIRRKIMKFIDMKNNKTISEVSKKFDIKESEAEMHLDFLKQALIVEKTQEEPPKYRLTTRGENYLKNAG